MVAIEGFDLLGSPLDPFVFEEEQLRNKMHLQSVKDYIVAIRSNIRQRGAHTKTRAEVNHSGQKPHPQKGTGKARQGYLGATQYKGGGRPKGPRAQVGHHVRINRKERGAAIRFLLSEKIRHQQVIVLKKEVFKTPKTKLVADFLKRKRLFNKRALFVSGNSIAKEESNFIKSIRNIPKVKFMYLNHVSGYDILAYQTIVLMEPAVESLKSMLRQGNEKK